MSQGSCIYRMGGRCIGTVGMYDMVGRTRKRALGIGSVRKAFGKRRCKDYIRELD